MPALVRELDDAATYEIALVENIQRQDLNAIEEASAYRKLIEDFGHNQEALAKLVGKSRSHVATLMRLLELPPGVRSEERRVGKEGVRRGLFGWWLDDEKKKKR